MVLRVVVFLVTTALVFGVCARYVHRHATRVARLGPRGRRALAAVLAGGVLLTVATRLLEPWVAPGTLMPFGVAGGLVGVAILLTAPFLALIDLTTWAFAWSRWGTLRGSPKPPRSRWGSPRDPVPVPVPDRAAETGTGTGTGRTEGIQDPSPKVDDVSRRGFITQALTGSALALGGGSAVYGTFFGRHDYVIEDVVIPLPGLSRRLDGYTLVQLSDVHLGLFVGEAEARAAEDLVRRARPDLIVLTGDLIDHDPAYAPALGRLVRRLAALSRDGIVAVPGNHDYYTGIHRVIGALESAGALVLRNGGRVIGDAGGGFALLGVDDHTGGNREGPGPDLGAALAALPAAADLPRVLLCHNPAYFPAAAGRVALQLSGHTHGGQLKLGVTPAPLVLGHSFIAGRYERAGSHLYVNRGFGTAGPPTRVGAPPEVTRIVLTG